MVQKTPYMEHLEERMRIAEETADEYAQRIRDISSLLRATQEALDKVKSGQPDPNGRTEEQLKIEVMALEDDLAFARKFRKTQLDDLESKREEYFKLTYEQIEKEKREKANAENQQAKDAEANLNQAKEEYKNAMTPEEEALAKEKLAEADAIVASIAAADKTNRTPVSTPSNTTVISQASVSQTGLEIADQERNKSLNDLATLQNQGITSGPEYEAAKQKVFEAEKNHTSAVEVAEEEAVAANEEVIEAETNIGTDFDEHDQLLADHDRMIADMDAGVDPGSLQIGGDIEDFSQEMVFAEPPPAIDLRVRLRPLVSDSSRIYQNSTDASIMRLLGETGGVIFPYTPTITYAHNASYSQMAPTHANQDYHIYNNTPAVQFQISGQFTAQNEREAEYLFACMHFFRTVVKMRFGENDPNRGLPPPVLLLSGYGELMFNDLPVVVTSFSMDMPNNVNYVKIDILGSQTWVPSMTTFNISVTAQNTPKKQRSFDWDMFAKGDLLKRGGWI